MKDYNKAIKAAVSLVYLTKGRPYAVKILRDLTKGGIGDALRSIDAEINEDSAKQIIAEYFTPPKHESFKNLFESDSYQQKIFGFKD